MPVPLSPWPGWSRSPPTRAGGFCVDGYRGHTSTTVKGVTYEFELRKVKGESGFRVIAPGVTPYRVKDLPPVARAVSHAPHRALSAADPCTCRT